jgi:hypothetical protein
MTPNEDHTGKEGYAVKAASGKAALCTAANDNALGVILDGEGTPGKSSIAILGGNCGVVRVKLAAAPGTVVAGTYLQLHTDGSFKADLGAGNARAVCARALESGVANEQIEAVLLNVTIGA